MSDTMKKVVKVLLIIAAILLFRHFALPKLLELLHAALNFILSAAVSIIGIAAMLIVGVGMIGGMILAAIAATVDALFPRRDETVYIVKDNRRHWWF